MASLGSTGGLPAAQRPPPLFISATTVVLAFLAIVVWFPVTVSAAMHGAWIYAGILLLPWGYGAWCYVLYRREHPRTARAARSGESAVPDPASALRPWLILYGWLCTLLAAELYAPIYISGYGIGIFENPLVLLLFFGNVIAAPVLVLATAAMAAVHTRRALPGHRAVPAVLAGLAGMALAVVSLVITLPAWRMDACRSNDVHNLKSLGLACLMYSGDWDGSFPPDMATIPRARYMAEGAVWVCPARPRKAFEGSPITGPCDYTYVATSLRDDNPNATTTVVAYSRYPEMLDGWINFLFVDGHVEGCPGTDPAVIAWEHGWTLPPVEAEPPD